MAFTRVLAWVLGFSMGSMLVLNVWILVWVFSGWPSPRKEKDGHAGVIE